VGLLTAAPAAALFAGIAFGDGSPGAASEPTRITLGLFDPPCLAPLPALGAGGSDPGVVDALARRLFMAAGARAPQPWTSEPRISTHRASSRIGAVDHAPSMRKAAREYVAGERAEDNCGKWRMADEDCAVVQKRVQGPAPQVQTLNGKPVPMRPRAKRVSA